MQQPMPIKIACLCLFFCTLLIILLDSRKCHEKMQMYLSNSMFLPFRTYYNASKSLAQ